MDNEKKRSILEKIAALLPDLSEAALDQLLSFIDWLGICDALKRKYD